MADISDDQAFEFTRANRTAWIAWVTAQGWSHKGNDPKRHTPHIWRQFKQQIEASTPAPHSLVPPRVISKQPRPLSDPPATARLCGQEDRAKSNSATAHMTNSDPVFSSSRHHPYARGMAPQAAAVEETHSKQQVWRCPAACCASAAVGLQCASRILLVQLAVMAAQQFQQQVTAPPPLRASGYDCS